MLCNKPRTVVQHDTAIGHARRVRGAPGDVTPLTSSAEHWHGRHEQRHFGMSTIQQGNATKPRPHHHIARHETTTYTQTLKLAPLTQTDVPICVQCHHVCTPRLLFTRDADATPQCNAMHCNAFNAMHSMH